MKSGDVITLVLRPGRERVGPNQYEDVKRTMTGKVRSFESDGKTCWEVETGDPQYPAIGFNPETAIIEK